MVVEEDGEWSKVRGKEYRQSKKNQRIVIHRYLLILTLLGSYIPNYGQSIKSKPDKIQIAFLLDVSGSMDQLIQKAKAQFWNLSSFLNTGTKKGKKPIVEFAIITYGLDFETDLAKVVVDFNTDADSVGICLYEIQIGGSSEHCWAAIQMALRNLSWSQKKGDLKLIVIAGNESFNQGQVESKHVIPQAKQMDVVINTIYCSTYEDKFNQDWVEAARITNGNYFTLSLIDSVDIKENFLDNKLNGFNEKLNASYIPFGSAGPESYNRMLVQDKTSKLAGVVYFRERVNYKVSDSFFNPNWDLVDAFTADSTILDQINPGDLRSLGATDARDLKTIIETKVHERLTYKEVIQLRYEMINRYIGDKRGDQDLNNAVKKIVITEGSKRNFKFGSK